MFFAASGMLSLWPRPRPTLSVSPAGLLAGREKPPQGWVCEHSAFQEPALIQQAVLVLLSQEQRSCP